PVRRAIAPCHNSWLRSISRRYLSGAVSAGCRQNGHRKIESQRSPDVCRAWCPRGPGVGGSRTVGSIWSHFPLFVSHIPFREKWRQDLLQAFGRPSRLLLLPTIHNELASTVDREIHRQAPDSAVTARA